MEKLKLEFSRNWNNPADFPTIETDEAKVRADMQALYDEIQIFLNGTLIPAMEALEKPGIANLPVETTVSNSPEKIPTSSAVSKLFASSGNLPAGGTEGQFLVKTGDDYGSAGWQSYTIPKRLSEVYADGKNGKPTNAQVYVDEIASDLRQEISDTRSESAQNREARAELIASGAVGFGDTDAPSYAVIELGDVSRYSHFYIKINRTNTGNSSRTAALYLGRGTGKYSTYSYPHADGGYYNVYSVSESGMQKIDGSVITYLSGYPNDRVRHRLEVVPFDSDDAALISYERNPENVTALFTASGVELNVLTLYARSYYYSNESDGTRVTQYEVYGIRRGAKEGE